MSAASGTPNAFAAALWRALAVYRFAALGYAGLLVVRNIQRYAHPWAALPVFAVMVGWTVFTAYAYRRGRAPGWPLLLCDLGIPVGCLLLTRFAVGSDALRAGTATIAVAWIAAPAMAWAIARGRRTGALAAILIGAADMFVRGKVNDSAFTGPVLTVLAAIAVGHVARLAAGVEERLQRAVQLEAATRERERLARRIHDSVLQVLALVQRRGTELGGEAAELGQLAGEQETALRVLIAGEPPAPDGTGPTDLRAALGRYAAPAVSLATPATPVPLDRHAARELAAAVGSALDNVRRHAGPGARAWVLVEDEDDAVTVSVRDDGVGFAPGRLAEAEAAGRLGVAQAIRGRIADLGGTVTITSAPGQGTEVEIRVPARLRLSR